MDAIKTAAHFDLPIWRVQAVCYYHEAFLQEIDAAIGKVRAQSFDTLRRRLPQLELTE